MEKLTKMNAQDSKNLFLQFIHPYFIGVLEDRLQEKKLHYLYPKSSG